ncbi:hypothetical protein ACLOAV_009100 [Pseudogymnoascus australis]
MLQFGGRIPATEEREEEQYRSRRPAFPKDLENGYGGQNKDERRAFIKGAKRINRQDLKVLKFANGLKDVQTFIDAVSWKHGITRAEFQRMSAEEGNELDEFLVLYLFNKLEGEPARWWTTLTAGPCCSGRSAMCSKWGLFKYGITPAPLRPWNGDEDVMGGDSKGQERKLAL